MEAFFSLKISELNDNLLKHIRSLAKDDDIITLTINPEKADVPFNETREEFLQRIQLRLEEYHASEIYSCEKDNSSVNVVNEPEP